MIWKWLCLTEWAIFRGLPTSLKPLSHYRPYGPRRAMAIYAQIFTKLPDILKHAEVRYLTLGSQILACRPSRRAYRRLLIMSNRFYDCRDFSQSKPCATSMKNARPTSSFQSLNLRQLHNPCTWWLATVCDFPTGTLHFTRIILNRWNNTNHRSQNTRHEHNTRPIWTIWIHNGESGRQI